MTIKPTKRALIFGGVALALGLVWWFAPREVTTLQQARELTLQQDLFTMRAIISQYALDKRKRPRSLDDLVVAGYLKQVPIDPTTGRRDTWVVECSSDRSVPGIVGIDSSYTRRRERALH